MGKLAEIHAGAQAAKRFNQPVRPMDLAVLEKQIADLCAEYPELGEDEQLRADMIEGSTDIVDVLAVLLSTERDAAAMQTAIGERIDGLKDRKERFKRRQEGAKKLMLRLMDIAGLKKLPLAEGTLSVASVAPSVQIVDEEAIPREFLRVKTEPDKTAIKEALKNNITVPGAYLGNGGISLRIL